MARWISTVRGVHTAIRAQSPSSHPQLNLACCMLRMLFTARWRHVTAQ